MAASCVPSYRYNVPCPGSFYTVGGGLQGEKGFTGCVGRVAVDGALTSEEDWYPSTEVLLHVDISSVYLFCISQDYRGIEVGVCKTHDWCTAEDGETQGYCTQELSRRVQASPRARTAGGASSCMTARCAAAPGRASPGPPAAPPATGAPAASGPRPGQ